MTASGLGRIPGAEKSAGSAQTVLLLGSGGREHAMAWKLSLSPHVGRLIVAPGNPAMLGRWETWSDVRLGDPGSYLLLAERAHAAGVSLVVVGPDNPLADGVVDVLEGAGLRCFGPRAQAARIEASKAFAKEVMTAAGVPTAHYQVAHSHEEALQYLVNADWSDGRGWVLKADGLALGKGVYVCGTLKEARDALGALAALGSAGERLVIEERLSGQEISWLAFCDGERCALLEPARDYKRIGTGDQGANTGGMGAFSPVPGLPASFEKRVREEIFIPVLAEMRRRDAPFKGVLYAGLMVDVVRERIWVIEFNGRFGDPEAQVLLSRMSDDFYLWCDAVARGDIGRLGERVSFHSESAVVVVAAARGYPDTPEKGARISGYGAVGAGSAAGLSGSAAVSRAVANVGGLTPPPAYFAAGMAASAASAPSPAHGSGAGAGAAGFVVNGGRVLGAMGMGADLRSAREQAYTRLKKISFAGMQFRTDIAEVRD